MKLTGFLVDETGTEKKGDMSIGVGLQYCDVCKTANSHVAVMGCLSNGDFASMVDDRLYLPEDWLCFNMAKELTEFDMIQLMFNRHRRRQWDINSSYLKEYANVSK